MPFHHIQTSFNGGEISRRLQSRVDTAIYAIAASEMLNMAPCVEGGAVKRPGTIRRASAEATATWLSEFIFNATQAYVLEWSDGRLRLFTNNALIPGHVDVPYVAADAPHISGQQSGDVLYLACDGYAPATLSRTGATTFSHAALDLAGGPFGDRNRDEGVTVTATGTTGTVTITASSAIFAAGHVGARFRIEADDFGAIPAWQVGIDGVTAGALRRSEGRVYEALSAGRTGTVQPVHTRGDEWDGSPGEDINEKGPFGILWRYRHDRFGIVKITGFVSPTEVTATVERRLPDSVVSVPTHRWAHGLFSAEAGWPHLVILWRGRLWFFRDFELAGSVAGDYRNFAEFDESGMPAPDMAIRRRLDLTDIPIWVRADRQNMMIGTARGEYIIGPRNAAEAISADNIDVVPHTAHGSAQVWPLTTAGEVIFTQRGGRKVRAAKYSFAEDRYLAPPVTLWARQITQSGVRQLAFQAEPEELLWALRADGTAVAHPYSPDQDTKGWARALSIEGAKIVSICCIPSPDGARDDLWLLVDRDGEVSIQQLAGWWDEDAGTDIAEAFFVDDGATFSGTPATQFSVPWLEGAQTLILADGAEHPPQIVPPGGLLTIPVAASVVTLGRPYTARLTTLRPEIPRRDGSGQGRAKRVVALIASLIDSFSVLAGSINGRLDRLVKRAATDPMTPGPPMFSGWTDNRAIGGGNDKDGRVTLEDRSPFPWILTATVSKIEEGDR